MKSGLGGSATLAAAILGCFNQFRSDPWDQYEMAELAFQAERLDLGIAGGWQDQYASVFGGFNFLEFKKDQNISLPNCEYISKYGFDIPSGVKLKEKEIR